MSEQPPVVPASRPSFEERFYLNWGLDSLKQTTPLINDTLGKLMTLNAALIGGGFAVAKYDVVSFWWTFAGILALIASLAASLYGLYPRGGSLNLSDPDAVREFESRTIRRKSRALAVAFIAITAAFLIVLAGLVAKEMNPRPPQVQPAIPKAAP